MPEFKFLAIKESAGAFKYDGIVGLAPNLEENGISYVEALHREEKIQDMMVSIFLTRSLLVKSYIQFGGY